MTPPAPGAPEQPREREGPIVTLDGPAGSGKSTTAREVARRLGFRHLDSGAFYRALTVALLERGIAPERWAGLVPEDFDRIPLRVEPMPNGFRVRLGEHPLEEELRTPRVTAEVSSLASLRAVRGWLLGIQREAGRRGRLVADGRDMGTVVFPDAEVKVFLTADLWERARRRLRDHGVERPTAAQLEQEAQRITERDRTDSERELSPLRRPADAFDLDTTGFDFDAQVEAIVRRVRQVDHPGRLV